MSCTESELEEEEERDQYPKESSTENQRVSESTN